MPRSTAFLIPLARAAGAALILALGAGAPARATPGQIHVVKRPEVNLRAGPGTATKIIGKLVRGARVMEFGRKGRWFRVKEMGRVGPEGWVHGAMIAPEPEPSPAVPAEPAPPSAGERGPGSTSRDEDGNVTYAYPRGVMPWPPDNRAFVPWGVEIRKHRPRKRKGRGGGRTAPKAAPEPKAADRDRSRNLGYPRPSGVPNIGTN